MTKRIDALANRVQDDQYFLASALRDYAQSEQLDDAALATRLGCAMEDLSPLRLCRRPRPTPPYFAEDVRRIAERFGIHAHVLAQSVRLADALTAMRRAGDEQHGMLVAARDRDATDPDAESNGGEPT